jgi:hypothetical protein
MKIARLLMVLLALTATVLSAAPKPHGGRPGGSGLQSTTDDEYWWFYCYSNPELVYTCYDGDDICRSNCEEICEGPCDWNVQN